MEEIKKNDETIIKYKYLVELIAKKIYFSNRFLNNIFELDDLISYGYFGLIDAIKKYSDEKNIKFETYASYRVHGAIIDEMRKEGKIKRKDLELIKKIKEYKMLYETKYNKELTLEELAQLLDLPISKLERFEERLKIANATSIEEDIDKIDYSSPIDIIESCELKAILEDICSNLSSNQKKFIKLYYYYNFTEKEIASILNVSSSRVSQIKVEALKKLRTEKNKEKLKEYL